MGQVLIENQIEDFLSPLKMQGKRIVFTNGCFDLLHVGHVRYLAAAKALGDLLLVGVNSDASVKRLKGELRPVQNQNDRAEILAALGAVDFVVIFNEDTPLNLIKRVKPDFLVKGGDWKPEQIIGSDFVAQYGGKTISLIFIEGKSTTQIVNKIEKQNLNS